MLVEHCNAEPASLFAGVILIKVTSYLPSEFSGRLVPVSLAEATKKVLGTNALLNFFWYIYLVPSPHISNIYNFVFLNY